MKFIIHSSGLLNKALELEKKLGEPCYVPLRDTDQNQLGDFILLDNFRALKRCSNKVYVVWDGSSPGVMFDMGMAYALGKTIVPQIICQGSNWRNYFKEKIGFEIKRT